MYEEDDKLLESIPLINIGLEVNTNDIESYLRYQIQVSEENIQRLSKKLAAYMGNYNERNEIFFNNNIKFFLTNVNGTKFEREMSIYQGYFLYSTVNTIKLNKMEISELSKKTNSRTILYFLENNLNSFTIDLKKFLDNIFEKETKEYTDFMSFVYTCLAIILGMTVLSLIISVWFVLRIKNVLMDIYMSYLQQTEGEYDERIIQLSKIEEKMILFRESEFYKNLFNVKPIDLFSSKTDKMRRSKRYTDKNYCFGLTFSLLSIGFFYLTQLGFGGEMLIIYRDNIDNGVWIANKQFEIMNMTMDQMNYYNALKQRLVLGKDTEVLGVPIDQFLEEFSQKISEKTKKVTEIFSVDLESQGDEKVGEFLMKTVNSSLCSYTVQLEGREELCKDLDNKIPEKGIVQVYFRLLHFFDEIKNRINQNRDNFDSNDVLNDPEFIKVEFAFENVYYWSFINLVITVDKFIEYYAFVSIGKLISLVVGLMIGFVLISFFFIVYSFVKVVASIKRVAFSFRLVSLNCVVGNSAVRMAFLKLYKLNQKYF